MSRVAICDVQEILPSANLLTDPQIQAAINVATIMVDDLAAGCGSALSVDRLAKVELYLSAHLCAVSDPTLSLKSEKDACTGGSVVYGFELGEGIKGTPFGQTANMLSGGCLAESEKQPASFLSIGSL